MDEKLRVLKEYDKWFFVVTDPNQVKKYKKIGDSIDLRYLKQALSRFRR